MVFSTVAAVHQYKLNFAACRAAFIISLTVLCLSETSRCCCAQQNEDIEQHFHAARSAQDAGDFSNAIAEYQAVLRLDPSLPEAHINLGLLYFACNQFGKSEYELRTANKLRPNVAAVNLWLGVDRLKQNDARSAVVYLERSLRLNGSDRETQRWLGLALWETGETENALDYLERNADSNESNPDDLFILGEAYQRLTAEETEIILSKESSRSSLANVIYGDIYRDRREWQKAIAHYTLALNGNHDSIGAHLGLGIVYLYQGLLDKAENEFHAEITLNRNSPASYSGLIIAALDRSDISNADEVCENAIRIVSARTLVDTGADLILAQDKIIDADQRQVSGPKLIAAISGLRPSTCVKVLQRDIAARSGKPISRAQGETVLQMNSHAGPPVALYDQAVQLLRQGNLRSAQQILGRLLRSRPEDPQVRYLLARVYHASCLSVMNKLLWKFPNSIRAHQLQAEIYESSGRNEEALSQYKAVAQMDDKLPGLHEAMGRLFWAAANTKDALNEFNKELQLNPDDILANAEIGTILSDQEEDDKAIPYLQKALKSSSEAEAIHEQLGLAYFRQKNYAKAEIELKEAVSHDPYGSANYLLGRVYRGEGRLDLARTQFAIAKEIITNRRPVADTTLDKGSLQ